MSMEKYSRGRRGAPAKGVGRVNRRESSNLSFSARKNRNLDSRLRFLLFSGDVFWKGFDSMSKILGSFRGMRNYLEQEMLAESLQGRIRYGCTSYVGMDGHCIFEVCIDGKQIKRFSWETVNTYFIDNGYTNNQNRLTGAYGNCCMMKK